MTEQTTPAPARRTAVSRRQWAVAVIALIAAIAFAVVLLLFAWFMVTSITSIPAAVAAPTITGSATVLVAVFSLLFTEQRRRKGEIEREHRSKKIEVYEEFYDFIFKTLLAKNLGEDEPSAEEVSRFFAKFTPKIMLWGDQNLLKAWIAVRQEPAEMLLAWENLLLAMREEIGHSNKGLEEWDIIRLFVNDIDDHINKQADSDV